MTTIVTVKNEGPDRMMIRYYNKERQFHEKHDELDVGQSMSITIWDDHLPVFWPLGHGVVVSGSNTFFSIPPATY